MKVCTDCYRCYDDTVFSCTDGCQPSLCLVRAQGTDMVAGYHLESRLASEGKRETYRARHDATGRPCLIKILSPTGLCSQQYLDDSKIAAALYHPNVADIYETGTLESGEVFIAAEDADGQTLRELLSDVGVPELLFTILVVRQAAEALHFLHQSNLVHRAICPENIILTTDAEDRTLVRIQNLDFGGAVERSILSNKFLAESSMNSLKYYAPEQCTGEAVGAQTDVYGLGVVFYEMLAGSPPFEASTATGLINKHRDQLPPDVRIDNFNLRMLVTHALTESLQKQTRLRQSSANVFARQLRHIEQLATHTSTPPPAGVVPPPPETPAVVVPRAATPVNRVQPIPMPAAAFDSHQESFAEANIPVLIPEVENIRPALGPEVEPLTISRVEEVQFVTPEVYEEQFVTAEVENQPVNIFDEQDGPVVTFSDDEDLAVADGNEDEERALTSGDENESHVLADGYEVENPVLVGGYEVDEIAPADGYEVEDLAPTSRCEDEECLRFEEEESVQVNELAEVEELVAESNIEREFTPYTFVETSIVDRSDNEEIAEQVIEETAIQDVVFEQPAPKPRNLRLMFPKRKSSRYPATLRPEMLESELLPLAGPVENIRLSELDLIEVEPAVSRAAQTETEFVEAKAVEAAPELPEEITSALPQPEPALIGWESENYEIDPIQDVLDLQLQEQLMEIAEAQIESENVSQYGLPYEDFYQNEDPSPDEDLWSVAINAPVAESVATECEAVSEPQAESHTESETPVVLQAETYTESETVLELPVAPVIASETPASPPAATVIESEPLVMPPAATFAEFVAAVIPPALSNTESNPVVDPPAASDTESIPVATPRAASYKEIIERVTRPVETDPVVPSVETKSMSRDREQEKPSLFKVPSEAPVLTPDRPKKSVQVKKSDPVKNLEIPATELQATPKSSNEAPAVPSKVDKEKAAPAKIVRSPHKEKAAPAKVVLSPQPELPKTEPPPMIELAEIKPVPIPAERAKITVAEDEPRKMAASAGSRQSTKIEWDIPEDDIPSVEDVIEAMSHDGTTGHTIEPEESKTTAVVPARFSPPSRNEVQRSDVFDVSRPAAIVSPPRSQNVEYCPTILGGYDVPKSSSPDRGQVMFGDHYGPTATNHFPSHRQALVGGAGIVGAIILFFLGDAVLTNRVQSQNPGDSVARATTSQLKPQTGKKPPKVQMPPAQAAPPQALEEMAELAPKPTVPKSIDELLKRDARGDEIQPRSASVKKSQPALPEGKAGTSAERAPAPSQPSKSARGGDRTVKTVSQGSSTLVISSQNGKVTSKFEPAGGSSRPRIVGKASH